MAQPIRVLLVEDNDVFRDSLEFLLDRRDDVVVVGAIGEGAAAADRCAELAPDVVVLDYRLPDLDGAATAEEVRERCPGVAVLFLSASTGSDERDAARRAHAPLVGKDEGVEALVTALHAVARSGAP